MDEVNLSMDKLIHDLSTNNESSSSTENSDSQSTVSFNLFFIINSNIFFLAIQHIRLPLFSLIK